MNEEFFPGFDSIGIRVSASDSERMSHLLQSLWAVSERYPCEKGECGLSSGDYFGVWTHIGDESISHILMSNPMPGMVAHVEEVVADDLIKIWIWDREDPNAEEPLYPLCIRTPTPWFHGINSVTGEREPIGISLLAPHCEVFESQDELSRHPQLGNYAAESAIPTGLFVEEGLPNAGFLVVGTALLSVRAKNEITGDYFHALRVRTLGGEVFVCVPDEAIEGDATGKIIAAQGSASGIFPGWLPEPIPEPSPEDFSIDTETVEPKIKDLWTAFCETDEFTEFFEDIHMGKIEVNLSRMFFFLKAARQMPKLRGRATPELAARYKALAKTGEVILAHIVMANTAVLYEGKSSPALVVIAFGDRADEVMAKAREVLSKLHFGSPETKEEQELAAAIEDEEYHFGRRRRLPHWLVGDVEAYAADLHIPGASVFGDSLLCEVIPCLAERGETGLTVAIPADIVETALGRNDKKPKPPPLPPKL